MLRPHSLRIASRHVRVGVAPHCPLPRRTPLYARLASSASATDKRKTYSHTLLLPKAPVPLKHKRPAEVEAALRDRTSTELYRRQLAGNPGPPFVLHDGPPYANGHLHMGHALNKTLKDIINRFNVIRGRRVHYVPGWDCHGLPIEHKALAALGRDHLALDPTNVRAAARNYALEAIDIQRNEMRALGVMADWDAKDGVYRTLDHDFEIRQLRLFRDMVEKGFITHRLRPVYYSPSSRTALAEAELVYQDHTSQSVYVKLPAAPEDMSPRLREIQAATGLNLCLAIWTTTPWSLAGNMGVAVGKDIVYAVVRHETGLLVVAEDRLNALSNIMSGEVVGRLNGHELAGTRYTHTFHPSTSVAPRPAVFLSKHVTSTSGTGLVHSAPAHGHEDYESFATAGIMPSDLRCPFDDQGRFTKEVAEWAKPAELLVGREALGDGTAAMIDLLRGSGALLAQEPFSHRYPCDWKTKQPVMVLATPQWFADVESIKPLAQSTLDNVEFHPPTGKTRLLATVLSRSEWCISRQRSWGVPIPALYDTDGRPILSVDTLDHIISVLDAKGTDHWWSGTASDFTPPALAGQQLVKGSDTLDVWFDSGSSWTLLQERSRDQPLADVYLEGSDQHRGWFQSSLLTRLAVAQAAPYDTVITHGFVMDEKGDKMSKSAGNGLSPMDIVHGSKDQPAYGADALRVWAAGVDYSRDVSIGPTSIAHAAEALRKLRSTLRFLLANADDSSAGRPSIIDRHVLRQLDELKTVALDGYSRFAFNRVLQAVSSFAANVLSTFYFDIVKDSLYCDSRGDPARQAVAATLHQVLCDMLRIIAPIAPHLAEEFYAHVGQKPSVFLDLWTDEVRATDQPEEERMKDLLAMRTAVSALVEQARAAKHVRSGSEARVVLLGDEVLHTRQPESTLAKAFSVASATEGEPGDQSAWTFSSEVTTARGKVTIVLQPTDGHECPRCWLHTSAKEDALCGRCETVLAGSA